MIFRIILYFSILGSLITFSLPAIARDFRYSRAHNACVNDEGLKGFNSKLGECFNGKFADLSKRKLQNINLKGSDLEFADFGGADLSGANFVGADLSQANLFQGAILKGTMFSRATRLPIPEEFAESLGMKFIEFEEIDRKLCYHLSSPELVDLEEIKHLLDIDADPNTRKCYPLNMATRLKNYNVMNLLIERGANPNLQNVEWENTSKLDEPALSYASDSVKATRILLSAGADPNLQYGPDSFNGKMTKIPLFSANPEVMKALLESGADPNFSPDGTCHIPLTIHKKYESIKILTEAGAQPNPILSSYYGNGQCNSYQFIPLLSHLVMNFKDWDNLDKIANLLIQNGASLNHQVLHTFYKSPMPIIFFLADLASGKSSGSIRNQVFKYFIDQLNGNVFSIYMGKDLFWFLGIQDSKKIGQNIDLLKYLLHKGLHFKNRYLIEYGKNDFFFLNLFKFFISIWKDKNYQDSKGRIMTFYYLQNYKSSGLELLLSEGLDINHKDHGGVTISELCKNNSCKEVIDKFKID